MQYSRPIKSQKILRRDLRENKENECVQNAGSRGSQQIQGCRSEKVLRKEQLFIAAASRHSAASLHQTQHIKIYCSSDANHTLPKTIQKLLKKQIDAEKHLATGTLLASQPGKLIALHYSMQSALRKLIRFAKENRISKSTVLSALQYLRASVAK